MPTLRQYDGKKWVEIKGATGLDGKDGLSAYGVALQNGFTGTKREWLTSLQGLPGKPGRDGSPDTAEQIRDKLKGLKKGQRLHFDDLDGTEWANNLQLARHSSHATGRLQDLVDVLVTVEPSNGQVLAWNSTSKDWQPTTVSGGGGSGDVVGPASATNNAIALFDGTTGKLIKDSGKALSAYFEKLVDDTDDIIEGATNKFNATHTGDVTGATALTIDKTAITGKSAVTAVGTDYVLISDTSDSGNLKKALASDFMVGGSGITRTITITSGSATMGASASTDYVYLVAGAHTMTLPTAVGNTNRYTVKNNHSAEITVDTTSAQTIDGTTSIDIAPEDAVDLISDNSNWFVI